MPRLTQNTPVGPACADTAAALEKLARCEDMCEAIAAQQQQLAEKMAALRAAGKEKTVQFRELMAQKLANAHTLGLLQAYRLL